MWFSGMCLQIYVWRLYFKLHLIKEMNLNFEAYTTAINFDPKNEMLSIHNSRTIVSDWSILSMKSFWGRCICLPLYMQINAIVEC